MDTHGATRRKTELTQNSILRWRMWYVKSRRLCGNEDDPQWAGCSGKIRDYVDRRPLTCRLLTSFLKMGTRQKELIMFAEFLKRRGGSIVEAAIVDSDLNIMQELNPYERFIPVDFEKVYATTDTLRNLRSLTAFSDR